MAQRTTGCEAGGTHGDHLSGRYAHHYSLWPQPSLTVAVATIAICLLGLAVPLFSIQVYDRIIAQEGRSTLYVLFAGVALALLLELALRMLRGWLIARAAAATEFELSARTFGMLAHADLATVERTQPGTLLKAFQAISLLREFRNGQAFVTLLELPFGLLYLGAIAYLGGWLVAVPALLLCLFVAHALSLSRSMRAAYASREAADRDRYDFLNETLCGIHTLKTYGCEQRQLRRYEALQRRINGANCESVSIANQAAGDGALFAQATLGAMVLAGAWIAGGGLHGNALRNLLPGLDHGLTMGALVACVMLAGRALQPVQRSLGLWHRLQEAKIARDRLLQLHGAVPREFTAPASVPGTTQPMAICLRDVRFSHGMQTVIDGLSLDVPAGAAVSISGAPGCGKSTLLNLVAGLYRPLSGTLGRDGVPAAELLSHGIAYLRQGTSGCTMLRGKVADNLTRFGQVELAAMLPLVRLLNLEQDIARLPRGYATPLFGGHADSVPPGFKQRLALARALAPVNGKPPRLVLYDMAEKGLDEAGYNALLAVLGKLVGQTTLLLVSHDDNIRSLARTHYVLEAGRLVPSTGPIHKAVGTRQGRMHHDLWDFA